jgi:hypothetical protein
MKIDKRKTITGKEVDYIISFMLNSAEVEMNNHVYYGHERKIGTPLPKYFTDTYKPLDLYGDPKVHRAMFTALSNYLNDNEELLIMYGHLDEDVVNFFEEEEA